MASKYYNEDDIQNIANAIRAKNGTTNTYTVSQMADAITELRISGDGGIVPTGDINITYNGTFDVTQYAQAIVSISEGATTLPDGMLVGTITLTENVVDNVNGVTIEHGFGLVPSQVFVIPQNTIGINANSTIGGFYMNGEIVIGFSCSSNDVKSLSATVKAIQNVTDTSFSFIPRSSSYPIVAGEYVWGVMQ